MAFKIFLEIIACNYFCFIAALRKYYPDLFAFMRLALQSKCWARLIRLIAFIEINYPLVHNFRNVFFADVTTIHPAQSMFCVVDVWRMTIKGLFGKWLMPSFKNKNCKQNSNEDQRICGSSCFHWLNMQVYTEEILFNSATENDFGLSTSNTPWRPLVFLFWLLHCCLPAKNQLNRIHNLQS